MALFLASRSYGLRAPEAVGPPVPPCAPQMSISAAIQGAGARLPRVRPGPWPPTVLRSAV